MEGYDPATYGNRIAGVYDQIYGEGFDPRDAIELLAELAGDGPVLELGIGTGRVALPLRARGVDVHGIDTSEAMVAKLRTKPGGAEIPVVMGDFASTELGGPYSLVYVPFNTLFALERQEDQVACFVNVAGALQPGGLFVVEAFVPDATRWSQHQHVGVDHVGVDEVWIEVSRHDPISQTIRSQHVVVSQAGNQMYPVAVRYAWPAELDLMARVAGMSSKARFGSWRKDPFTSDSRQHVSVYEKPAEPGDSA